MRFCSATYLFIWAHIISSTVSGKKIFCYYSSFAQTREGPGNFLPEDIDPDLCTHIIYAFVDITPDGRDLAPFNRNDQGPSGLYARTLALKQKNPTLKVLLAVGGWQIGSKPFIPMVRTERIRKAWVGNVVAYLRRHGFDGFDVDWEFPATRGSPSDDKYKFTLLMKELYEAFAQEARETGQEKLILTMATASGTYYISQSYEPHKIINYLDYMLLMTYNYHGMWERTTGHHSGLYPHRSDPKWGEKGQLYQEWSIDYWLDVGIPKEKLIVGIPTYAMTFTLADQSQTGVGAPAIGGGRMGRYTEETGILAYYEICENLRENGWDSEWIEEQAVPYAYGGDQWAGYENIHSVTLKAKNILNRDLAGAFVWSVEMGDYRGTCGQGPYPLLSAIHSVIGTDRTESANRWHPHRPSRLENLDSREKKPSQTTSTPPSPTKPSSRPTKRQSKRPRKGKLRRLKAWRKRKYFTSTSRERSSFPTTTLKSFTDRDERNDEFRARSSTGYRESATRPWYRETSRHRQNNSRRKWKKKARQNAAAAAKDLIKSTHNSVWGEEDADYENVPETKWWSGLRYNHEDDDSINARATARPRYLPAGPVTRSHVMTSTAPTTHVYKEDDDDWLKHSTAASASAGFSGASGDYCEELGVGTFAHPLSCDRFIICLPGNWRKYPPHVMSCPVGTRFDASLKICNYAALVPC